MCSQQDSITVTGECRKRVIASENMLPLSLLVCRRKAIKGTTATEETFAILLWVFCCFSLSVDTKTMAKSLQDFEIRNSDLKDTDQPTLSGPIHG